MNLTFELATLFQMNAHPWSLRWMFCNSLILIFISFGTPVKADLIDGHIKPTLQLGFDWTGLGILAAGSAASYGAYTQEDHLRREWGQNKLMSKEQTRPGDIIGMGVVGGTVALGQIVFDSPNGWAHAEALVWTFLTTHAIKYGSQKERPNGLNRMSMPSGHTSTAFASATHLTYAYGWWVGVPSFALATYTGLTRIADDAHWLSDVVAGATLGIFWARATYGHHSSGGQSRWDPWFLEDGGFGVRYSLKLD